MPPKNLSRIFFAWALVLLFGALIADACKRGSPVMALLVVAGVVIGMGITLCTVQDQPRGLVLPRRSDR